ncbi:MAG: trypsin [Solirubrobacteraceae bacterium]
MQRVLGAITPIACVALAAMAPAQATAQPARTARPLIVGGTVIAASAAPWQVYLRIGDQEVCGGSVLDSKRVLSAAHCADGGGAHPVVSPDRVTVLAGFSDVSAYRAGQTPPAGTQVVKVAALSVHPYYDSRSVTDDVMVLTLSSALDLSGPNVKAITLATPGLNLAAGAALQTTGFGQSSPSNSTPDGKLRALAMTAVSDDDCRTQLAGNSAVVLCASATSAGACSGDSGGALTSANGSAQAQVGVVRTGSPISGCAGVESFTDVTAPEVRVFIDGAASVPRAPRQQTPVLIRGVLPAVNGSPIACSPGAWDGSPAFAYAFQADGVGVLQSGPVSTYAPRAQDVGRAIVCVVRATNTGGTSTARSAAMPPIRRDVVAPTLRVTSLRCSRRTCRIRLSARDPNSAGAVAVRVTARYRAREICASRRKGAARKRRCTRVHIRQQNAHGTSRNRFAVTMSRLPYKRVTFAFVARDAAGNRQRRPARRTVKLRRGG